MANTQNWSSSGAFTITLAGLGSNATNGRQSSELALIQPIHDLQVMLEVATTGTPSNDNAVYLYVYGSIDGINYPTASGVSLSTSDSAVTNMSVLPGIPVIILPILNNSTGSPQTFRSQPISIAQIFGGTLPQKIIVGVRNYCGQPVLSGAVRYTPIWYN